MNMATYGYPDMNPDIVSGYWDNAPPRAHYALAKNRVKKGTMGTFTNEPQK